MGIRSVIDHEIDDDADAPLAAAMGEFHEITERAVPRVDIIIIRDIVAVVFAGRRLKWHQPDRGDAQSVQIVEPPKQTFEVADTVAIGIHVGADRQTIEDAVLEPEVVDHAEPARDTAYPSSCIKRLAAGWFPMTRKSAGRQVSDATAGPRICGLGPGRKIG